ncbi:antibiotic biosynthesis monooxygenase [Striga asiatica]|uniref:Antibiotic biosynthesis monooxygenase n=1 Tax=Striga asiatica TaxID=4170 RepID=A0A5A7QT90_STRAF|nr:antibiotic biosynthesis monooxygenase [Striga asiatica]
MASASPKEEEEEGGSAAIKEDEEKKIASFLEEIKHLTILTSMLEPNWNYRYSSIGMGWIRSRSRMKLRGIDLGDVRHYSDAELCDFTNGYSDDNIFRLARNGRLFKARVSAMPRDGTGGVPREYFSKYSPAALTRSVSGRDDARVFWELK